MGEIKRGFFGIGIYSAKKECNVDTLFRSSLAFGADFTFVIGRRYRSTKANTCKSERHVPMWEFSTFDQFLLSRPKNCKLVGVECPAQHDLNSFVHPERAIYLLGAEDSGLPADVMQKLDGVVAISSRICLNVSMAGSIVMFHRQLQRGAN